MKTIWLTITLAAVVMAAAAETFTGVITDTMCGANHNMMKKHPADQCVKMCAKGQYSYALYDGTVKVTGTLDQKNNRIKVSSFEPIAEK